MPFNIATAPSIIDIFEIEATDENLVAIRDKLSAIELVDGGSMIPVIEAKVLSINTLRASSSTVKAAKQNQVVQAGKIKFKDSGIGQGSIDQINIAMVTLGKLLGSPYREIALYGSGDDAVSMYRDDPYDYVGYGGYIDDWSFFNW